MFEPATAEPEVCPYLGLPDDPRTRFTFADSSHRCHVGAKPIAIDLGHQGAYCLTSGHPACKRFRLPGPVGPQGSSPASTPGSSLAVPPTVGSSPAPAFGVVTVASSRASGTDEGRDRSQIRALRRVGSLVAILGVVAVFGAIQVGAIGGSPAGGSAPGIVASPVGATPPVPTPVTSVSAAIPTAGLSSRPPPTSPPVVTATPVATHRPERITHVVVRGDSLTSIALLYGVTVKAIRDANDIRDPNFILVGHRLVIPPPP